jgi:BMFP domain-containing protein YqiC
MTEFDAQEVAQQIAEQVAQQVGQAVGETIRQVVNATLTARPQEIGAESEFETGMDESYKALSPLMVLNGKRTYDEFQDISLAAARRSQNDYDEVRAYSRLALQNAVNNADLLAKQAIAHRDIAIDREWNVNETDAYATVLAAKIAQELNDEA